ncbi:MAG TPA: type IV secretion system DNA-binding domain-containing protein [Verrucomicrobiota bacterium]|nr:type IV secretion system DNA-binding domain-containing protein [Verrucomicrobiota bacterium]HRR63950.1 type IV secretion system DNA-binding domain-containing protein [Candidatus Paceibacterota bacterium]HOM44490.1 type IV secretion system DNA-binding domain-containing protein [Verrucomicrobiota bacterium]HOQ54896.1 type IV secretion system DNA-binding domain-containing protein [Verrucomicrobiota bacterium]HPC52063.1 type IV secretion system DNA-binding domain-containing protein [Verrucomicro
MVAGGIMLVLFAAWLLFSPRNRKGYVAKLGGLTWKRTQFCRGWLITGDTGSGKTSSGINQLAHQVFKNEPTWGGLCIDEKGVYWETLTAMAKHYGREGDLIQLRIRTGSEDAQWTPQHRFNLTSDRSIPFTTYAKFVVDTATSLGQGGDKGFFKSQAQTHIAHALEMLYELKRPVTLLGAFELLSDRELLEEEMENLESLLETPRREAVYAHFANRFLNQPDEQSGGVRETIGNYLQYFLTPEVAEVFCGEESTFDFATIDQGKIILTTMPQKFQTERRYVNTFLKLLYYSHALRRFDQTKTDRAKKNLLILWADEAQRFMTASEDGTSDYNCVDVIREAGATIVAAAQSTTSFVPPLGNDKSKVLTLNLRNRMIFRAADEADAVQAADFLGKKRVVKRSWGFSAGKRNVNYSETEEHKIKPHKLRNLRDHECVLVHCERGFRRVTLPPLEFDGTVSGWFPKWKRLL